MKDRQRRKRSKKKVDHRKLPVGQVLTDPIKGDFLCFPLIGWVGVREKVGTPLVMLLLLLIESAKEPSPRGTLQLELPVFPESEKAIVATLERFGWSGQVWPRDEGWPPEGSDEEKNLRGLLEETGLAQTLVFPSADEGMAAQSINVQRARGPFLMPPLPKPETEVDSWKLEQLRELCKEPQLFQVPFAEA